MLTQRWGRAVVVGSSIAGLLVARVLSEHFREVVLVERDRLPDGDERRPGTPQARHVHGLLARGAGCLEEFFPGLGEELSAAGAPRIDHGLGARTQVVAGTFPATETGITVQTVHRDTLEAAVRRRVTALEQITVLDGTRVEGLLWDAAGRRVTGVRLTAATAERQARAEGADLVVDASGRFSQLPEWLEQAGYPSPSRTVVDPHLAYVSRLIAVPRPFEGIHGFQQMCQAPDQPGGAYAADVGNGRWLVTLFGAGNQHPPTDEAGWNEFAAGLGNKHLDILLKNATPLAPLHQFKQTRNQRYDYAALRRWPDRLLAVGDSVCAFNPVFGQGMDIAVREAVELGRELTKCRELNGTTRRLQRRIARLTRIPWAMSTSEDWMWHYAVQGRRAPLPLRAVAWYKARLLRLAVHDPAVVRVFVRVFHRLASPVALAHPSILAKVLLRPRGA
ncbi:FAD-dependent oxidoreductase [Streptomyces sp. BBFR2]|uniref:FAD-dependent oxidoreductase n=1 Tax=Streptomyces sp. BBFR2 TaxID=3372854 RepID=UPI0037DA70AA